MLQSMRDNSQGIIAKILVGLIIVVFALWGVDSLVGLATAEPPPAEVNGKAVEKGELFRAVELQRRQVLSQMGDKADPALLDDVLLRKVVLDNLIDRTLQVADAEEKGLFVSDQLLDQIIVTTKDFQRDGRFDRDEFELALRSAGFTPLSYRELLRSETMVNQVRGAYSESSFMTDAELNRLLALNTQTRDLRLITLAADQKVDIADSDVQALYESRKCSLATDEQVIVQYVALTRDQFVDTASVTDAEINSAYSQFTATFDAKEERLASHILFEVNDQQDAATAKAKAEELLAKINAGADFAEMAKANSQDMLSASSGGELGYLSKGLFEGPFDDALFALQVGQVSAPVETEFGIHLIKLNDLRKAEVPSKAEMLEELRQQVAEQNAEQLYVTSMERLADLAFSSGDLFALADELGLKIETSAPFSRAGGEGDFAEQKVIRAAFADVVLKEKLNSDPIEVNSGRTLVMHLKELIPARTLALDEVKENLVAELKQQRAAEQAMTLAQQTVEKAKAGEKLNWTTYSAVVRGAQNGLEPAVIDAAFALARPEGDSRFYATVATADGGAVVVTVDAVGQSADAIQPELRSQIARMLATAEGSAAFQARFNQLKSKAEIKIN